MKNAEESQETDSLDALLPSESSKHSNSDHIDFKHCTHVLAAHNETVLTAMETCEYDIQHNSQTITEFNIHSNDGEINLDSTGELFYI